MRFEDIKKGDYLLIGKSEMISSFSETISRMLKVTKITKSEIKGMWCKNRIHVILGEYHLKNVKLRIIHKKEAEQIIIENEI